MYYICKHLYFSCENVDIYENCKYQIDGASVASVVEVKEEGVLGSAKFKCLRGHSECNF